MQNCSGYQSYCVPEPETLLGVARPQGAKQHRAHRHQEDQHRRVVEVYVIPKQKKFIYYQKFKQKNNDETTQKMSDRNVSAVYRNQQCQLLYVQEVVTHFI